MTTRKTLRRIAGGVAVLLALAGCGNFLQVEYPNVVSADDVDPLADATTLSVSALQDFASAYGTWSVFGGIFTGELYSADVNSGGNLVSVRQVDETATNGYFASMSRSRVLATKVVGSLKGTSGESSVNAARAWNVIGYAFLNFADYFCTGAVDGGTELTTAMMLDSAVANLTKAIDIGTALGASGAQMKDLALVGRARAHLAAGRKTQALADAQAVTPGFRFDLVYINDLTNITRLGNIVWHQFFNIGNAAVAPPFQNLSDPRVLTTAPAVNKLRPMDGVTEMWSINKYNSYAAPIRLASKLEADYIAAEAQGTAAMLAVVAARRAANAQPVYAGATDDSSVLVEFLRQKTLDFYVEGKRMGDYRRYPTQLPFLVPAGTVYRKPNVPAYGNGRCWPLPIQERTNNPNLR
jgi:hypothetical protein